ncbi:putative acyltransferase [Pseudomonas sp. GM49]|uniref:acyltransferase family protein n=1 Tax=Pseudomonas sp. GM49 TaxID=1144331 RepID=UPI00026FE4F8|nr:acyltransferase [Pseudomonas sp. GM49]EJM62276.1 putative acyltransferase [Pseudomonas sp. GM49]
MSAQEIKKYNYIDALRGIAIILVVFVHASQYVQPLNNTLWLTMIEGARGVQLFYIASAITLCMSWDARKSGELNPVRNFYLRRVFRIAPMFYLAIIGFFILNGTSPTNFAPSGLHWWFFPMTALFLHGLHPETINSVVPGGWSVAVEMTFYLLFPALMLVRKFYYFVLLLILCLLLQELNVFVATSLFVYEPAQKYMVDNFVFFNFIGQAPVFVLGVMAYICISKNKAPNLISLVVGGAMFIALSVEFWCQFQTVVPHHVIAGGVFAIFAIFLACYPVKLFVNPIAMLLGKLSFSMYLIHIAVLKILSSHGINLMFGKGDAESIIFFLFVLLVTTVISWFTYRFIEKPGIAFGRKLIDRLEAGSLKVYPAPLSSESAK